MHKTITQSERTLPNLQKDRPKKVIDDYFQRYQIKNRVKLSEPEMAKMMAEKGLKVDQSTINRIRKGKLYPDIETALKFATYLEMDFVTFIGLGFWVVPNPDSLSIPARDAARTFEMLNAADKKVIDRVIKAISKTEEKN